MQRVPLSIWHSALYKWRDTWFNSLFSCFRMFLLLIKHCTWENSRILYASKGHLVKINNAEKSFSFDAVKHLSYLELGPVVSCLGICWGFFINFKMNIIDWSVAKEISLYNTYNCLKNKLYCNFRVVH